MQSFKVVNSKEWNEEAVKLALRLGVIKKKKIRYSFLERGGDGRYAIVIPKHRRGCPSFLVIKIGMFRPVSNKKQKDGK